VDKDTTKTSKMILKEDTMHLLCGYSFDDNLNVLKCLD
jgi:hypothetical protein